MQNAFTGEQAKLVFRKAALDWSWQSQVSYNIKDQKVRPASNGFLSRYMLNT